LGLEKTLKVSSTRFFRKSKYGLDKFVLIGRQKIHYIEVGRGDSVIILIPGSVSTYRAWNRLMPLLADDYRMLALDYPIDPSFSKESLGDLKSVQQWTEKVVEIIQHLRLSKVKLIGWGFGGAVAFDLAARFADLIDKIVSISWYINAEEEKAIPSRLGWKKWGIKRNSRAGLMEEAKNIKLPVLYLYGTETFKPSAMSNNLQFLQKYLPQTWIIGLEGGIFELLLKNPREVSSLITKFLHTRLEPVR
jgi:hypothetical protein